MWLFSATCGLILAGRQKSKVEFFSAYSLSILIKREERPKEKKRTKCHVFVLSFSDAAIGNIINSHFFSHRTEKDKASPSPYLCVNHNGVIEYRNDQVVVSTCKLHVYKFPFDFQKCNISFKSIMYSGKDVTGSVNVCCSKTHTTTCQNIYSFLLDLLTVISYVQLQMQK